MNESQYHLANEMKWPIIIEDLPSLAPETYLGS